MPASVVSITGRREGTYVLLETALPGKLPQNIGVILMDAVEDRAWVRLRHDYQNLAEPDDAEVLEALEEDIRVKLAEIGRRDLSANARRFAFECAAREPEANRGGGCFHACDRPAL